MLDTDPNSRLYRYAKRAYLIIDRNGVVRYVKILDNPRELIANDELLAELEKIQVAAPARAIRSPRGKPPAIATARAFRVPGDVIPARGDQDDGDSGWWRAEQSG